VREVFKQKAQGFAEMRAAVHANHRINSDPRQRRFAPLSRARYAERYACPSNRSIIRNRGCK